MCESLSRTTPKAKKEYTCIWCGQSIHKGDKYLRSVGVWEGVFSSNAWHPECDDAANDTLMPCETFEEHQGDRPKLEQ